MTPFPPPLPPRAIDMGNGAESLLTPTIPSIKLQYFKTYIGACICGQAISFVILTTFHIQTILSEDPLITFIALMILQWMLLGLGKGLTRRKYPLLFENFVMIAIFEVLYL